MIYRNQNDPNSIHLQYRHLNGEKSKLYLFNARKIELKPTVDPSQNLVPSHKVSAVHHSNSTRHPIRSSQEQPKRSFLFCLFLNPVAMTRFQRFSTQNDLRDLCILLEYVTDENSMMGLGFLILGVDNNNEKEENEERDEWARRRRETKPKRRESKTPLLRKRDSCVFPLTYRNPEVGLN